MLLSTAIRYLKVFYRQKISFVLVFVFPFFFLFIFSMAFGSSSVTGSTTFQLVIINNDLGITEDQALFMQPGTEDWVERGVGANLSDVVLSLNYPAEEDEEAIPIFEDITLNGSMTYTEAIEAQLIDLVLILPENFSLMVLNIINSVYGNQSIPGYPTDVNATISMIGDTGDAGFSISRSILQSVIDSYLGAVESGRIPQVIDVVEQTVIPEDVFSIFDFIAAGIFVFASILAASYFTPLLLMDREFDQIRRVKISLIRPWQYVTGYLIATFGIMLIQFALIIIAAIVVFGFSPPGSLWATYAVLVISSMATYALIFNGSALFKTADAAGNILGFGSSILGFASGAFFEMPNVVIVKDILGFTSGSPDLLLWDFFPWTHAVNAIRAILLFNRTMADVSGDIILLTIMSAIWLLLGLYFYTKRTFKVED